jgi:hypothetical protein
MKLFQGTPRLSEYRLNEMAHGARTIDTSQMVAKFLAHGGRVVRCPKGAHHVEAKRGGCVLGANGGRYYNAPGKAVRAASALAKGIYRQG